MQHHKKNDLVTNTGKHNNRYMNLGKTFIIIELMGSVRVSLRGDHF